MSTIGASRWSKSMTETFSPSLLHTYAHLPSGVIATPFGDMPVKIEECLGEIGSVVKSKTMTRSLAQNPALVMTAVVPSGEMAIPQGAVAFGSSTETGVMGVSGSSIGTTDA